MLHQPREPLRSHLMLLGAGSSGGSSDVWMWEAGIGLLWETAIFMATE